MASTTERLRIADVALDDWLHTYADDMCDKGRVREACERIANEGGTIAYIARVRAALREDRMMDSDSASGTTTTHAATHTPGPWMLATSNSWRRFVTQHNTTRVCEPIKQNDGHPDLLVSEADARLIAAAPDLLEALKELLNRSVAEGWCYSADERELAERAIAKAEGK